MIDSEDEITMSNTKIYLLTIGLICLVGLIIRLILIDQASFKIDYDEAMIGLLTRQVMNGELHAFVPGQPTLGSIEAYFLTPLFTIFGDNVYSFRTYSILINIGYILSTISLGTLLKNRYTGLLAGILAAIAPAYMLITGLKTWGTTIETIVFGNLLFISVVKTIDTDKSIWLAFAGFIAGVLFWGSWLSAYYIIPCLIVILYFHWKKLKNIPLGIIAFLIGSSPLWWHNINHGWESFATVINDSSIRGVSRLDTLMDIATNQYPKLVTGYDAWFANHALLMYGASIIYGAGIITLLYSAIKQKNRVAFLLSMMLMVIPLIYTQSGYGAASFNAYSVDATGRYLLMIHSALPIGVALFLQSVPRKPGVVIATVILSINLIGITQINTSWAFDSPYYNRQPDNMLEITDYLIQEGYTHIWTDVGIAQPLMIYSHGMIKAADFADYHHGGIQRFPEIFTDVFENEDTIFLVPIIPGQTDTPLSRELQSNGITFDVIYHGKIALYIPDNRVDPESVVNGLGLQY